MDDCSDTELDIPDPEREERVLKEVAERISRNFPAAEELWFHGSRARGDARVDSDWDFLVVVSDDEDLLTMQLAVRDLGIFSEEIDIQCQSRSDFESGPGAGANVGYWAQEEGYCIWESPDLSPHSNFTS